MKNILRERKMKKGTIFLVLSLIVLSLENTKAASISPPADPCYSKADGTLLRITDSCNSYIYCLSEKALTINCPAGMGFNSLARGCVDYSQSDCTIESQHEGHLDTQSSLNSQSSENFTINWSICDSQHNGTNFPNASTYTMSI
ncbi:uncharacterized protein [Musca autumnalis]|uniref:uncharacterized protein n=1 Tax=Musca autumnalis TaxID=221902 RepID=UPI003CF439BD